MAARIFISYSHSDARFADRFAKDLEKAGYEVWLDRTDIKTGARWDDEIVKGLNASAVFLVLLSKTSTASQNVKDEIGYALDQNKQILPILIETCEIPFRLRRVQYVDFTTARYAVGLQTVLKIIESFSAETGKTKGPASGSSTGQLEKKQVVERESRKEERMQKKKSSAAKSTGGDSFNISIKGNSNVAAVGRGARATFVQGSSGSELDTWRKDMERRINALKDLYPEDKSALNQQLEQIAREVEKGPQADAGRLERLLNMIGAMAPDIFEVAVTTLLNPLAGIGLVAKKIGDKAQVQKV